MKSIQLLAAAALAAAPLAARADTPGDTLTVNSAVPSTCAVTGSWQMFPGDGGSFSVTGTLSGGTFTFASSQLTTADGHSLYSATHAPSPIFVGAPIYCNAAVTASVHATNGALRYTGTTPPSPFGYYFPETVNLGFESGPPSSQPPAVTTGIGTCSVGGGSICSSTGHNTPFTTGTLSVTSPAAALTIGTVFIRYGLSRPNAVDPQPVMVAGAYSETLVLTITPQ